MFHSWRIWIPPLLIPRISMVNLVNIPTLWQFNIAIENHHFFLEHSEIYIYKWGNVYPCSIAMCFFGGKSPAAELRRPRDHLLGFPQSTYQLHPTALPVAEMAQIAGPKALHVQHLVSWTTRGGLRTPKENNTSGEDQAISILLGYIKQLYLGTSCLLAGDLSGNKEAGWQWIPMTLILQCHSQDGRTKHIDSHMKDRPTLSTCSTAVLSEFLPLHPQV